MKSSTLNKQTTIKEKVSAKKPLVRALYVLGVLLAIAAVTCLVLLHKWILVNPFSNIVFEAVSDVTSDPDGNIYLVSDSTMTVLKISPDAELLDKVSVSEIGASSASHIKLGTDGNLYIHDVMIDRGVRIQEENILQLSTDFKHHKKVSSSLINGQNVRQSYAGISPGTQDVHFTKKESFAFSVYKGDGSREHTYYYENADDLVMYVVTDPTGEDLYYVTYNGEVHHYVDGIEDEVLYDSDWAEGSVPQNIVYNEGKLYVTDIGLRNIIVIDIASKDVSRYEVEDAYEDRVIHLNISAENGLITSSGYSYIVWGEDGTPGEEIWEISKSSQVKLFCILTWASLIYLSICAVILLIYILWHILTKASVYTKTAAAIMLGVVALVALLIGTLFPEFTKQLTDQIFEKEILAAYVTSENLPVESFQALEKPSDFMNDDYMRVRETVQNVFNTESGNSESLYCVLYRVIDGTMTLTYSLEDICVVYPYDWGYEGTDDQLVMEEGQEFRYTSNTSSGSFLFVHCPLRDDEGNSIGIIEVGTDLHSVVEKNKNILFTLLINVLAMTAVVIMLVIELMYYVRGKREYQKRTANGTKGVKLTPEIFRFIVFLIFFFTNLTCVILPIQAVRIADQHPIPGISSAIAAAIPLSAEVFSGAIFSMLGSSILRKLGAKRTIFFSSILFTTGLGIRVIPSILALSLGSVLIGAGWGLLLILVNVQIAELDEEEKDKGYAYYSISAATGGNCAVMLGCFLVQWCSYTVVFAIAAIFSITLYFVCRKYLSNTVPEDDGEEKKEKAGMSPLRFIFSGRVIGFFVLILIPLLICGYFLNYMFPILGVDWGLSDTFIGYAFMINCMCAVILGTPLTTFFTKRNKRHVGLFCVAILYALGFLAVAFLGNVPSLIITITILGIADSFGVPLFSSYFTELPEVEKFGYDRSFSVYSLVENAAQSMGAFVLGMVYDYGIEKGMYGLVILLTCFAVLFLITAMIGKAKFRKKEQATE